MGMVGVLWNKRARSPPGRTMVAAGGEVRARDLDPVAGEVGVDAARELS